MQHDKLGRAKLHFRRIKAVNVLLRLIFLGGSEALPLNTGHIQHVQLWHSLFKSRILLVGLAAGGNVVLDICGNLKLLGRYKYKVIVGVAGQRFQQGMYRSSVLKVAAKAYCKPA